MELEERLAYVWTLQSQARVGSYQHTLSSAPWMVLAAEEKALRDAILTQYAGAAPTRT